MGISLKRIRGRRAAVAGASAGLGVGAAALTGAVAFACTAIMGPMQISPASGPVGTSVSTSATGLIAGATYEMHLSKKVDNNNCMSFTGVFVLGSATADGNGAWNGLSFTIPAATMGVHYFCGIEKSPVKSGSGTSHDTFTIT